MKLVNLIEHIKNNTFTEIQKELPDIELDMMDIYMKDSLSTESEIKFFDADKITNKLIMEVDGITLVNLFPLAMFREIVEDYINAGNVNSIEIANKILDYRIKDA